MTLTDDIVRELARKLRLDVLLKPFSTLHKEIDEAQEDLISRVVDSFTDHVVDPIVEQILEPMQEWITEHVVDEFQDHIITPITNAIPDVQSIIDTFEDWVTDNVINPLESTIVDPVKQYIEDNILSINIWTWLQNKWADVREDVTDSFAATLNFLFTSGE